MNLQIALNPAFLHSVGYQDYKDITFISDKIPLSYIQ